MVKAILKQIDFFAMCDKINYKDSIGCSWIDNSVGG